MNSNKFSFYTNSFLYIIKTLLLRRNIPFMGGIAINDRCNLKCSYCSVSNRNIPDLTFEEIRKGLVQLHEKGIRYLYIEGGEPFLWRDENKNPEDIIRLARSVGFSFITLYTNGTSPIETSADTVFVSLDGLKPVNDTVRGKGFETIVSNIVKSSHKKIIINCTISQKNKSGIEEFCACLKTIKKISGIFFYFYTSVKGKDDLYLNLEEKRKLIGEIIRLKKMGYRILNSKVALTSAYKNNWQRPNGLSYLFAENQLYRCCRFIGEDTICENCGYLGFTELFHIARLNPEAVFTAFKYL